MSETMTYDQFLQYVAFTNAEQRELDITTRYGQVLFNALAVKRPDIAEELRGSLLDPFHLRGEQINLETWQRIRDLW